MKPEETKNTEAAKAPENAQATETVKATEAAGKKPAKTKEKKVKVHILVHNMAGKYLLPYNKGQVAELTANQAEEVIEAGDGCLPGDEPKAKK